jgi:hypothetical protein
MTLRGLVIFLTSILFAPASGAESVVVIGRKLDLDPPNGFCLLGNSEREIQLLTRQRDNAALSGELAQFTVPCDEVSEYLLGKIDSFSRWAQVLVVRRQGQLGLVSETREEFVRATARNASTQSVDFAEVERKANQHLSQSGMTIGMSGMEPIGIKDSAFFAMMRMTAEGNGVVVPIVAVVAATVVNRLPIVVQVYRTQRATDEPVASVAVSYVQSVINKNDE